MLTCAEPLCGEHCGLGAAALVRGVGVGVLRCMEHSINKRKRVSAFELHTSSAPGEVAHYFWGYKIHSMMRSILGGNEVVETDR